MTQPSTTAPSLCRVHHTPLIETFIGVPVCRHCQREASDADRDVRRRTVTDVNWMRATLLRPRSGHDVASEDRTR